MDLERCRITKPRAVVGLRRLRPTTARGHASVTGSGVEVTADPHPPHNYLRRGAVDVAEAVLGGGYGLLQEHRQQLPAAVRKDRLVEDDRA